MLGAPSFNTPGTGFVTTDTPGGVDDCRLTVLPPWQMLSALVTLVRMVPLLYT